MVKFLGKNALIVEDDDDIRGLLEIILGQMGFEVTSVATGAAGLENARSSPPDLVTLDLGLPDMDGVDVLARLRTFHDGTVVVVSSRSGDEDRARAVDSGATAYLHKPFRPAAFKQDLVNILGG